MINCELCLAVASDPLAVFWAARTKAALSFAWRSAESAVHLAVCFRQPLYSPLPLPLPFVSPQLNPQSRTKLKHTRRAQGHKDALVTCRTETVRELRAKEEHCHSSTRLPMQRPRTAQHFAVDRVGTSCTVRQIRDTNTLNLPYAHTKYTMLGHAKTSYWVLFQAELDRSKHCCWVCAPIPFQCRYGSAVPVVDDSGSDFPTVGEKKILVCVLYPPLASYTTQLTAQWTPRASRGTTSVRRRSSAQCCGWCRGLNMNNNSGEILQEEIIPSTNVIRDVSHWTYVELLLLLLLLLLFTSVLLHGFCFTLASALGAQKL